MSILTVLLVTHVSAIDVLNQHILLKYQIKLMDYQSKMHLEKSMAPIGVYEVTVKLGKKNFTHSFIICKELTSAVILGLDFSNRFQIGSDWTPKGYYVPPSR